MGTDIHGCLEVRIDGVWHFLEAVDLGRNYGAFTVLFDTRNSNDMPTLAGGRGLPKDMDEISTFAHCENLEDDEYEKLQEIGLYEQPANSSDSHSHSWVLASEIPPFLDKPIKFIYIHKKGWREKAKADYADWKKTLYGQYEDAKKREPEKQWTPPDDIIGTEEAWLARTEPLAVITPGAKIHFGLGGANIQFGFLVAVASHINDTGFEKLKTMDQVLEIAKEMDRWEIVEDNTTMKQVHGWLEDKEWSEFIMNKLPALAQEYGGDNVRWSCWFDN